MNGYDYINQRLEENIVSEEVLNKIYTTLERLAKCHLDNLDRYFITCKLSYDAMFNRGYNRIYNMFNSKNWYNVEFFKELSILVTHFILSDKLILRQFLKDKEFDFDDDTDDLIYIHYMAIATKLSKLVRTNMKYHGYEYNTLWDKISKDRKNDDSYNVDDYMEILKGFELDDIKFTYNDLYMMILYDNYILFYNLCIYSKLKLIKEEKRLCYG